MKIKLIKPIGNKVFQIEYTNGLTYTATSENSLERKIGETI